MKFFKVFSKRKDISTPPGYQLVSQRFGDLDGNGQDECVTIFNTAERDAFGSRRELQIHRLKDGKWDLWIKSNHALPPSEHLGIRDYSLEVEIENGQLNLRNILKSNWNLDFTDSYKLEDGEFKFVKYQSLYGKSGEYWIKIDLDGKTGKMNFRKDFDKDPNRESEIEELIIDVSDRTILNRNASEISFVTPNYGIEWGI